MATGDCDCTEPGAQECGRGTAQPWGFCVSPGGLDEAPATHTPHLHGGITVSGTATLQASRPASVDAFVCEECLEESQSEKHCSLHVPWTFLGLYTHQTSYFCFANHIRQLLQTTPAHVGPRQSLATLLRCSVSLLVEYRPSCVQRRAHASFCALSCCGRHC